MSVKGADHAPSAARSEELLAAACRIIANAGTRRLSMRDVAEEAGVSKGLLHYYFATRHELLARAYEYSDQRGRQRVWRDVETVESGAIRLRRLLDLYLSDDPNVDEDWVLWSELSSTAMFEPELRPVMEASFARWCAWIESLVRDAIQEGAIRPDAEPADVALLLTATVDGLGALVARQLVERKNARLALQSLLNETLGDRSDDMAGGRPEPPATGYLRLLAGLTRTAVEELRGLASTEDEDEAIRLVSSLIDARTGAPPRPASVEADGSPPAPPARLVNRSSRGLSLHDLPTPAAVVSAPRLDRNLARFATAVAQAGVAFRPDLTAHRCLAVASRQLNLGAAGIAVSTAGLAEAAALGGCADIVITDPVLGAANCARVARLAQTARVAVHVASIPAADALHAAASQLGVTIPVRLAIGYVAAGGDDAAALALAHHVLELAHLKLDGIAQADGVSISVDATDHPQDPLAWLSDLAARLRRASIPLGIVAGGSTATARSPHVAGLSEVRAGTYAVMDAAHVRAGVADADDVALTVRSAVVDVTADGVVRLDAGWETFGPYKPRHESIAATPDGQLQVTAVDARGATGVVAGPRPAVGATLTLVPARARAVTGVVRELVVVDGATVTDVWPTI